VECSLEYARTALMARIIPLMINAGAADQTSSDSVISPYSAAVSRQLDNQVALVTGAARGLGRAIAEVFAHEGATIVVADLKQHWAQVVVDEVERKGGRGLAIGADVSDRDAVAAVMEKIGESFGRLDIVVNNAMWNRYEPIADIRRETLDRMLGIGFGAVVWTMQAAAPLMRATGGGSIINIASVSAQLGIPNALLYCGIKAGVTGLTRSAATELGPDHIRVNAISPSTVATEGVRAILSADTMATRVARTPLHRLGETGDIAAAALFLASGASNFITGQVLTVDGGLANAFM
jgi:NAD(P)-dependent dehydrogenase (short-subunit alcohol dehydrogenase family)